MKQPLITSEILFEEKRSRFITELIPAHDEEHIKHRISELKKQHPKASHVCSAFRISTGEQISEGFSDDGEPSGTAGMPILKTIRHKDLTNCAVLITRYFGGTKLGTGGLQRAYSQAASQAIQQLTEFDMAEIKRLVNAKVDVPFDKENLIRHLIQQSGGASVTTNYHNLGVTIDFEITEEQASKAKQEFSDKNFIIKIT